MFDWLMEPINAILSWLFEGIYHFFVQAFAYFIEVFTYIMILFTLWATEFAWDVASAIIVNTGINNVINTAFSFLPAQTRETLNFFRVLEAITLLITSLISKYVMRFIPFMR